MGIEEYKGISRRVNTAGYLCMCVYIFTARSVCVTVNQVLMYFKVLFFLNKMSAAP